MVNFKIGMFGPEGYRIRGFRGGMREATPPGGSQGEGGRGHQGNWEPVHCQVYLEGIFRGKVAKNR
jgi:hypothetical protein